MALNRKLRMGMVGGGQGAFIGAVHRMAANLDGKIELVAGCFSSDPKKSKASGKELFLSSDRIYTNYEEMAKTEAALPADKRIDFVSIVTPNHMHFPVAAAFLKAGINVVCDKPMTFDLAEAKQLRTIAKRSKKVFALTHNYTGYPMVKEARDIVSKGKIGKILKIVAEYPQGWLIDAIENDDQKQAAWRTDPKRAGASCCMGDIGTHAENLGRYITGLEIDEICAEFTTFVPGRKLEDDGNCLIRYKGGAKGILFASQISAGEENNLNIRIYGTKGSLEWFQEHPNELVMKFQDKPRQIIRRGNGYVSKAAAGSSRLPAGHQEAFLEAFANIYVAASDAIADEVQGKFPRKSGYDFPGIEDGVYGMAFIETVVKSAGTKQKWTKFPKV
ncbi:Gfo/Idh/MocA family oxidoreductase [Rubellicoccus peritrichatus]|uniref:Gfo/Idh/MocA family oxidoreductase n=1 Tax=Rubellicoccus peritrichatus TaxID=3080537 RepID=A0AAQ3L801_9BACT|nr:Gfo/Idh/MocA family oxidoreductase [Puniceicoccus sp. CR14]WOO41339.1 Gfo/Idh/MocA family oxidoreductase [Puniceicoccus sp. CR14]